ncbi:MAG: hypothetical protein U5Q44_13405 [Dehalococcoidia bacterium]|nr:hypothetical protein [Dehalococcoidia bacterium]
MVGSTTYYAVADYPEERNHGKWPPLRSNSSTTDWRWLGYKDVTVVDGAAPSVKYIVAQLKDRDGFCDGVFQHNTLGVEVGFTIDSGAGRITDVSGRPWTRHQGLQSATATTFDTHDSRGNPINTELWEFLAESDDFAPSDDCLAWVEVSNSLLKPVNFLVEFPRQPAPVPGDVRITDLQCTANESFEVTNVGDNPVSLEGFSVRSLQNDVVNPEEHLDLRGYLEPGDSAEFRGAPFIEEEGWLFSGSAIFDEASDYARLVWNDFEIHRAECDGDAFVNDLPDPLPADREGEILVDLIAYGDEETVELSRGWNLVTAGGEGAPIGYALGTNADAVSAIYGFNPGDGTWDRFITGSPGFVNTLETFESGQVYWVHAEEPFTLSW